MTTENNEKGPARAAGPRSGESHRQWLDRIFDEAQGKGIDTDQVWRTMVRLGGDTDDIGNVIERALASRRPEQWRTALLTSLAEVEGLNAEAVTAPVRARPGWTRQESEDQLERAVEASMRSTSGPGPALRRAVEMWIEPAEEGTNRPFEQAPNPTRRTSPMVTRQRQAGAGPAGRQVETGSAAER